MPLISFDGFIEISQYLLVLLLSDWHGVLFIRQGLYQEGVFKFSVQIPENYPDGDAPVRWLLHYIITVHLIANVTVFVFNKRCNLDIGCIISVFLTLRITVFFVEVNI